MSCFYNYFWLFSVNFAVELEILAYSWYYQSFIKSFFQIQNTIRLS